MNASAAKVQNELLLAAARHRPGSDWFDEHSPEAIHWPAALEAAQEHGVLPLLNQMLAPQSQVVGDCLLAVSQQVRLNHLRNMQLLGELRSINARLRAAGIRMLPYKGPTLAMHAYGDLSLRMAGDLDILVAPADAAAAERVLIDDGYIVDADQPGIANASVHDYHREFSHPARRIMVELHWRVVGDCFSFEPQFEDFWDRAPDLTVGDDTLRVMSPEDSLLVLAAHGMKHFWSRLGWICDVAELIRRHPAMRWNDVLFRAKNLGGERIVLLAVQLAKDVCWAPVPQEVIATMPRSIRKRSAQLQKHLFRRRADAHQIQRGMRMELAGGGRVASLLFHLRMRERWSDGLRYVIHRMFTPTAIERDWINLPRPLSPLYFVMRPIRLAVERFRTAA